MTWRSHTVTGTDRGGNPIGALWAVLPFANGEIALLANPSQDLWRLDLDTLTATEITNKFGPFTASMIWDAEGSEIGYAALPRAAGGRRRGQGRSVERFFPNFVTRHNLDRTGFKGGETDDVVESRAMAAQLGGNAYLWTATNLYRILSGNFDVRLLGPHGLADVQAAVWYGPLRKFVVYAAGALRTYNVHSRTSEFYRHAPRGIRSLFVHDGDLWGVTEDSLIEFDQLNAVGQVQPPVPSANTYALIEEGLAPDLDLNELRPLLPRGATTHWTPASNYHSSSNRSYRAIVLHTTESRGLSAVDWFQSEESGASTHYLVTETGDIYQCVRDADVAWAQGVSSDTNPPRPSRSRDLPPAWKHVTTDAGTQATFPPWYDYSAYNDPNTSMLSIEIAGFSDNHSTLRSAQRKYGYKYLPTPISVTMPVGSPQFQSLVALVAYLSVHYDIPVDRDHVIKHEWLTGNKFDPGAGLPHLPLLYEVRRVIGQKGGLPDQPALPVSAGQSTDGAAAVARLPARSGIDTILRAVTRTSESGAVSRVPSTSTADVTTNYAAGLAQPTEELPAQTVFATTERTLATETGLVAGITADGRYVLRRRRARAVFGVPREVPLTVDDSLRIRFEVNYKENGGSLDNDPWKIEIYNLSNASNNVRYLAPGNLVEISAGYGALGVIARGGILAVERAWEQPDRITRILCGGLSAYTRTPTQQPFSGTIASKALALIGSLGGVLDNSWQTIPEMSERTSGWTSGDPARLLAQMLKYHGLAYDEFGGVFTIRRESPPSEADNQAEIRARNARAIRVLQADQRSLQDAGGDGIGIGLGREGSGASTRIEDYDLLTRYAQASGYQPTVGGSVEQADVERDSLYITRPDDPLLSRRTRIERLRELYETHLPPPDYVISERTGMVGRVMRTEDGIKAKIRLTAGLYPGRIIDVFSADIAGSFEITEISHKGDSWEGEFTSTVTAARTSRSVASSMPYLTR